MVTNTSNIRRRYRDLLRRSLGPGTAPTAKATQRFASQISAAHISMIDLAIMHEQLLQKEMPTDVSSRQRRSMTTEAGIVFSSLFGAAQSDALAPEFPPKVHELLSTLSRRSIDLSDDNDQLSKRIEALQKAEALLMHSEQAGRKVRIEAERLQEQLRLLSRQLMNAQEEERRSISRELHDVIGQILAGINIRLATLKHEAQLNSAGLDRHIAQTQRLVHKSVGIVHRFARKLRPPALDDLGLLPALQAHIRVLTRRHKIQVTVAVCSDAEQLSMEQRTALFRVAQEALCNVIRHARASTIDVQVVRLEGSIHMVIQDDGRSFDVQRIQNAPRSKHLGLLGMRERVEMLNGTFEIEAQPGIGTTIRVTIPMNKRVGTAKEASV